VQLNFILYNNKAITHDKFKFEAMIIFFNLLI